MLELWLPILLSTVLVFIASALFWMVLPHHKKDWSKVNDEDALLADLAKQNLAPGNYMFPHCTDMKETQTEGFMAKYEKGPVGMITIRKAGPFSMNKELGQWFLYVLGISILVAYVTSRTVGATAGEDEHEYLTWFRVAGTTAFLAYAGAIIPQGIWKSLRWSTVWKEVMDGLVYALLTAGTFGWLA